MLLIYLQTSQGLCNGTQLIFKSVSDNERILICSYTHNDIIREVVFTMIILKANDNEFHVSGPDGSFLLELRLLEPLTSHWSRLSSLIFSIDSLGFSIEFLLSC